MRPEGVSVFGLFHLLTSNSNSRNFTDKDFTALEAKTKDINVFLVVTKLHAAQLR
jgi:hypothetical protein